MRLFYRFDDFRDHVITMELRHDANTGSIERFDLQFSPFTMLAMCFTATTIFIKIPPLFILRPS
jgi:hypothetical protein